MSYASPRRHRSSRGSSLNLPPNFFARRCETLRRPEVLLRLAAVRAGRARAVADHRRGRAAALPIRTGDVPPRKIIARVDFQLRRRRPRPRSARRRPAAPPKPSMRTTSALLEEVRQELTNKVGQLVQAESFDSGQAKTEKLWQEFSPPRDEPRRRRGRSSGSRRCRPISPPAWTRNRFDEAVKRALAPLEKSGLLKELKHKPDEGSQVYDPRLSRPAAKRLTHHVDGR